MTKNTALREELRKCRTDPARFNETILGRDSDDGHGRRGYWPRQREICRSVVENPVTLVPTGNAVGKSFVDSGLLHWFLAMHPNALVVATAPSQVQLEEVLWKEVERAYRGSRIPLGGRLLKSPCKVDLGDGWQALGYSTKSVERFSGHHGTDLFAIVDEASGVADEIYEAISSLNPSRELLTGNPLRPNGTFYERCQQAHKNPLAKLIQISSLESPHIDLPRSPWGLADATWLAKARADYGEASIWWICHVLGLFPDSAADSVIPRSWLDLASEAGSEPSRRSGKVRMAIDLGEGNGGDKSVIGVRDDNRLLDLDHSNTWSLETTASRAALKAQKWGVPHHHISFDVGGIGSDFANRLESVGLRGCRPYRGGNESGDPKYANWRTAGAWRLRQRLDPNRMQILPSGISIPRPMFAIRPDWMALMREELQGLRYSNGNKDQVVLEKKEEFAKRLRHSPDFADMMGQLFYFTD